MTEQLRPCPFCGNTDLKSGGDDKIVGVWCENCQMTGPNHYGGFDWNTRPSASREIAVKPLEWHEKPMFEKDEYGCDVWGEFQTDSIVATCKTIYCGIYRHSFDKFMWVDGTLDNIRYSTYRKPPTYEKVEIPWFDSVDAAKAAAQADYERRILSAIVPTPGNTDPMLIAKYDDELRKVQGGWRDMDDPALEQIKKDGTDVLVYSIEGIELAWWSDGQSAWMTRDGTYVPEEPTHWMPLPPAPTEHPTEQPSVSAGAVDALEAYQQADQDGIMVLVSRQAIEECLPALRSLAQEGEG